MLRRAVVAAGLALSLVAAGAPAAGARAWQVSITNLTPAGSQPFTGPLLAVHSRRARVWREGRLARRGVWKIAEDGDTSILEEALMDRRGVGHVLVAGRSIAPGRTRRYRVRARGRFDRLSIVTMLVNTNDGFTGVDSLRLRGGARTLRAFAYDAGSERNSESRAFVPGPCCGSHLARDPERRPIRRHPGISGRADVSARRYGWTGPVARIRVRPVR